MRYFCDGDQLRRDRRRCWQNRRIEHRLGVRLGFRDRYACNPDHLWCLHDNLILRDLVWCRWSKGVRDGRRVDLGTWLRAVRNVGHGRRRLDRSRDLRVSRRLDGPNRCRFFRQLLFLIGELRPLDRIRDLSVRDKMADLQADDRHEFLVRFGQGPNADRRGDKHMQDAGNDERTANFQNANIVGTVWNRVGNHGLLADARRVASRISPNPAASALAITSRSMEIDAS